MNGEAMIIRRIEAKSGGVIRLAKAPGSEDLALWIDGKAVVELTPEEVERLRDSLDGSLLVSVR
jgi:hypothetical protein